MVPGTPAYKVITREMAMKGFEDADEGGGLDLNPEFEDASQSGGVVKILDETMRRTLESQERQHALTQLRLTVPRLEASSNLGLAMDFLYRIQCDANSDDMELALKAAIAQCGVPRFTVFLRKAEVSRLGWDIACNSILMSIDKHFLHTAKASLGREMVQQSSDDPTQYADRVLAQLDVYVYFAGQSGKTVDLEEIARSWVGGLSQTTRVNVSVALSGKASYTIQDALEVARIAHGASTAAATVPLQSMSQTQAPYTPAVPNIDGAFLKQVVDDALAQATAGVDNALAISNARLEARIAALQTAYTPAHGGYPSTQAPSLGSGLPTKFPCAFPACKGALHRFVDCPYKKQCVHCPKKGHHSEGCYKEFPGLSHFDKAPYGSPSKRERSPDRRDHRSRSRGRSRERDRDRSRDSSRSDGKRLNDKGRG
jgi:hypothetical protein